MTRNCRWCGVEMSCQSGNNLKSCTTMAAVFNHNEKKLSKLSTKTVVKTGANHDICLECANISHIWLSTDKLAKSYTGFELDSVGKKIHKVFTPEEWLEEINKQNSYMLHLKHNYRIRKLMLNHKTKKNTIVLPRHIEPPYFYNLKWNGFQLFDPPDYIEVPDITKRGNAYAAFKFSPIQNNIHSLNSRHNEKDNKRLQVYIITVQEMWYSCALSNVIIGNNNIPRNPAIMGRLAGCKPQFWHRDAKSGYFLIQALTDN